MNENLRALCERHGLGSEKNVKDLIKMAFGKGFIQRRAPKGMSSFELVRALVVAREHLDKDSLGDIIDWAYEEDK